MLVSRPPVEGGKTPRIVALVKALTGEVPNINHVNNRIDVKYARQHLEALAKYAGVTDII
jgi:hypothetical protein